MKKIISIIAIALMIMAVFTGCGGEENTNASHKNCMFIGYADPNRRLDGSTIISTEPKTGYRAVYVDRDDIYNTYHFH